MKDFFKKLLPPRLKWVLAKWLRNEIHPAASIVYGQEGEDLALLRHLGHCLVGFYVDVGAHHPSRFSNTLAFSIRGWRGINIEANPDAAVLFEKARPRDVNLNMGIGKEGGEMEFHRFTEPALNTFSREVAELRKIQGAELKDVIRVGMLPLAEVLKKHLSPGTSIDLLTVDVEGFDLEVLRSNDWKAYRPRFIIVEILDCDLNSVRDHEITRFLADRNYTPFVKTGHSVIFEEVGKIITPG